MTMAMSELTFKNCHQAPGSESYQQKTSLPFVLNF
jgi:hypothetical protein